MTTHQYDPEGLDEARATFHRAVLAGDDHIEAVLDAYGVAEIEAALDEAGFAVAALGRERDAAYDVLFREGWKPCDTPACNCGSWHRPMHEPGDDSK